MKKMIAIVLLWAACGYVNFGLTLGYFTHRFPEDTHVGTAMLMALFGPVGLPVTIGCGQPAHWRTKPLTTDERWKAFQQQSPMLDREYFERNYN